MAYATEADIAHTLTTITHAATGLGGAMGCTYTKSVPRTPYAAGANRTVMAAPLADATQVRATAMFFDIAAPIAETAAAGALVSVFTAPDGGGGSKSVTPMLAGDVRTSFGRVGEPCQQDFESAGTITDTTSI